VDRPVSRRKSFEPCVAGDSAVGGLHPMLGLNRLRMLNFFFFQSRFHGERSRRRLADAAVCTGARAKGRNRVVVSSMPSSQGILAGGRIELSCLQASTVAPRSWTVDHADVLVTIRSRDARQAGQALDRATQLEIHQLANLLPCEDRQRQPIPALRRSPGADSPHRPNRRRLRRHENRAPGKEKSAPRRFRTEASGAIRRTAASSTHGSIYFLRDCRNHQRVRPHALQQSGAGSCG